LLRSGSLCILTSRNGQVINERLKFYRLRMPSDQVDKYCHRFGLKPTPEMKSILTTPMMLSLYRRSYEVTSGYPREVLANLGLKGAGQDNELVAEGEVLWNFTRAQLLDLAGDMLAYRELVVTKLLPAIAHWMCEKGTLEISDRDLDPIVDLYAQRTSLAPGMIRTHLVNDGIGIVQERYGRIRMHESYRNFFAAVYLSNELMGVIAANRLPDPPCKEPPRLVKRYFVGILDHEYLLSVLDDPHSGLYARSTAAVAVGDLYFHRAFDGYPSRLTASIGDWNALVDNAVAYFRMAAQLGDAMGHWSLGQVFRKLYERAQEEGNTEAMQTYGQLAFEHTQKACESGLPYGYNQMGVLYQLGIGVEQDRDQAVRYFEKGVELKVAHSFNRLGRIHEDLAIEEAKKGNLDRAAEHYIKAFVYFYEEAEQLGEAYGMNRVTLYYYEGLPELKDESEARRRARELLGRFDERYIRQLPNEPIYDGVHLDAESVMRNLLYRAALAQNKHAVCRYNRLFGNR
jgi:TPR repeat protein